MTIRELLKYVEHNQKIIIRENVYRELFKGTAREISLIQFGEREVRYLIVDNDLYTREFLKIEVERCIQL